LCEKKEEGGILGFHEKNSTIQLSIVKSGIMDEVLISNK